MIDPKRTAILFTANSPQLREADLFIDSLLDESKGNFKGDLWVISTGLSNRAKAYLRARGVKYYINPLTYAYKLKNWQEIAKAQPQYARAKGPENERLAAGFSAYRNKRMSKLIVLDWVRLFGDKYDYMVLCDNDLYVQKDVHNLFEKMPRNPEAIWYWREEYESLNSTIIQRQNFHYKRLQDPTPLFLDDKEINIGFIMGKPKRFVGLFSQLKNLFYHLHTELLIAHGWQDQALTRIIRAHSPEMFHLFDEGDIVHLCNGGRHTVVEHQSMNFIHVSTKNKFTIVHFAAGKQKYFPPISFSVTGSEDDFYNYKEHKYIRSQANDFNCWDILHEPSKYCSKDTLQQRDSARLRWIKKNSEAPKKKILASAWFGKTGTHSSLFEKTQDFWAYNEFNVVLLNGITSSYDFGNIIYENMPEAISHVTHVIKDIFFVSKMGYRFSNIPKSALSEAIECWIKEYNCSEQAALAAANVAYMYFKETVLFYQPDIVALIAFQPHHRIFRHVCTELGVPYIYVEYGVLDGTYSFDVTGSMGSSWASTHHEFFNALSLNAEDLTQAASYISGYNARNLSRNPKKDIPSEILNKVFILQREGKSIVLCAGSNDPCSGNIPYTEEAKNNHAPYYKDNQAMLDALIEVADASHGKLHILYKAHPIVKTRGLDVRVNSPNATVVVDGSLDEYLKLSDLTVVNLSQSAYVSLLNDVPVLMAGNIQINHSGAVYTLEGYSSLTDAVEAALQHGYTSEQKESFTAHVARLLKYYVYSYTEGFGRPLEQMAQDLLSIMEDNAPPHLKYEVETYKSRLPGTKFVPDRSRKPKISVVMPIHNAGSFLIKSFASLKSQTFQDFEVICVLDDCSDWTEDFVKYFEAGDPRFKHITVSFKSPSKTRNAGIELAQGEYLYFFDADDAIEPDAFESLLRIFDQTDAECVFFLFRETYRTAPYYILPRWYDALNFLPEDEVFKIEPEHFKFFMQFPWPWMRLYKRKFFMDNELVFPEFEFSEDLAQCYKTMLCMSDKFYFYNRILYNYTNFPESTARKVHPRLMESLRVAEYVNDLLISKGLYTDFQPYWARNKAQLFQYSLSKLDPAQQEELWESAKTVFYPSDFLVMDDDFTASMTFIPGAQGACTLAKASRTMSYKQYLAEKEKRSGGHSGKSYYLKHLFEKGFKSLKEHGVKHTMEKVWKKIAAK
jgi:glycosyltransferase involved in cell wall biosynthesis